MPLKISIIIPSFNQGPFLEETLETIFAQENVDREILVFDGGSTDQTVEVLRRHDARLAYWESTPDRGQTHAINKGLARMSGDVWMYLNSDDLLVLGALSTVERIFADPSVMWVGGSCENFDSSGLIGGIRVGPAVRMKDYLTPWESTSICLSVFRFLLHEAQGFRKNWLLRGNLQLFDGHRILLSCHL